MNYYEELGVSKKASEDEIRRAYYKLLRKHSPEKDPERFKAIRKAYETLSDSKLRQRYDSVSRHGERIEKLHTKADEAFREGSYKNSARALKKILALDNHDSFARWKLAYTLIELEQLDDAVKESSFLTTHEPEDASFWIGLGDAFCAQSNASIADTTKARWEKKARSAFLEAARLEPHNAIPFMRAAWSFFRVGETDNAIAHLDKAIEADGKVDIQDFEAMLDKCFIFLLSSEYRKMADEAERIAGVLPSGNKDALGYFLYRIDEIYQFTVEREAFEPAREVWRLLHKHDPESDQAEFKKVDETLGDLIVLRVEFERLQNDGGIIGPVVALCALYYIFMSAQEIQDGKGKLEEAWEAFGTWGMDDVERSLRRMKSAYPRSFSKYGGGVFRELWNKHFENKTAVQTSGSDCFVLTAVYEDETHPVVKEFRAFRDEVLVKYWIGRLFIDQYYVKGPGLAKRVKGKRAAIRFLRFLFEKVAAAIKAYRKPESGG